MTKTEEDKATEEMRKMTREEMMKVDPNEYMGVNDRVDYMYKTEGHYNIPLPILETEDDEFIAEYITEWIDEVNGEDVENISY